MKYCEKCKCVTEKSVCPYCAEKHLREAFDDDFCFVCELDEMKAKMLIELLKNNSINFITEPSLGSGLTMSTGLRERENIFVEYENLGKAIELSETVK